MEPHTEYLGHIRAFESMLYTKGYRGDIALQSLDRDTAPLDGPLNGCLKKYLSDLQKEGITREHFTIVTHAEYLSEENYKRCTFHICFDQKDGLAIERILLDSRYPDETQRITVRHERDIPGKNAVLGRFRKPKPWERHMRGDFKHRKRW